MIITRYGISLERMSAEHAEMVRLWRNDPKIQQHMFFKNEITAKMQEEWFQSVDNDQNFYFLIHHLDKAVGLINISSVDWENNSAFAGLFIADSSYWGTDIPVRASLCLLDVFFAFTSIQNVYAKVRDSNLAAYQYNTALGFQRNKKIEFGLGYEFVLSKNNFFSTTEKLRKASARIFGTNTTFKFGEKGYESYFKTQLQQRITSIPKNELPVGFEEISIL